MSAQGASRGTDLLKSVLRRLDGVSQMDGYWIARCPAHDDRTPSLSVSEGADGRILIYCHAGCSTEDVVAAMGLEMGNLFPGAASNATGDPASDPVEGAARRGDDPASAAATVQRSAGLTLAEYAAAKRLPEEFLRSLGLSDVSYQKAPAVRVPYRSPAGEEIAVRFRTGLSQDRFRWKKGAKPCLYGLDRLGPATQFVVLVEGESDAQTLLHAGVPVLGIPGANGWRESRDAVHVAGVAKIFVVVEPDRGGQAVLSWIEHSSIRDRVHLVHLNPHKDVSELFVDDPDRFKERFDEAMRAAIPWACHQDEVARSKREEAFRACRRLAESPHILDEFMLDLGRLGVVGEERNAKILFLVLVSRLLPRPVSLAVKGPSSAGKSYLVERVLEFFPESAYFKRTSWSERALAYTDEPLSHRFVVLFEAAGMGGDFAQYLVRSLLSEGRISYETVEKTQDGLRPRLIEKQGPTGLIVTTTEIALHPENETRLITLTLTDSKEQTRQVMRSLAIDHPASAVDLKPWLALQVFLDQGDHAATIPYSSKLAELIPTAAIRLRRDFGKLLDLIRAHTLLHQATRARDEQGRVIATLEDYSVVRGLIAEQLAYGLEQAVPATIRETVEAVAALTLNPEGEDFTTATVKNVAAFLEIDRTCGWRRVKAALREGYLKNEANKGRPFELTPGDPLPKDVEVLPLPESLQGCTPNGGDDLPPTPLGVTAAPLSPPSKSTGDEEIAKDGSGISDEQGPRDSDSRNTRDLSDPAIRNDLKRRYREHKPKEEARQRLRSLMLQARMSKADKTPSREDP